MDVPASRASGDGWDEVGYPTAGPGRPSFVFPPPRQSSGSPEEYGRVIGEQMREWGDLAESTADEVHNLGDVLVDYGDTLEELGRNRVMPWAVPTVAPLSQTINRQADPTFQLQGFMHLGGWTGTSDGHRHALGRGGADQVLAEGWDESSRVYVAFITPAVTRAYQQLNFMVGEGASSNRADMQVSIYLLDENRVLQRQVGPLTVQGLGVAAQWATVDFDTFIAEQGSYIAIAFGQPDGTRRPLLGLHDTQRPLTGAVFPPRIAARSTSPSSFHPQTIDGTTQLDFEHDQAWFVPYAELSEHVGVDYRHFTESWGHGQVAPRPWVALTSTGVYSFDTGQVGASGFGTRVSIYDTPLSTDYVRIRSSIAREQTGITPRRSTLIIRGNNNLSTGLGLTMLGEGAYQIITWSNTAPTSSWDNRTVQATLPVSPSLNDAIEIDYLDGDLTVRINGTVRSSLSGLGEFSGAPSRFLGIQTQRTGNVLVATASPRFGPWSARDLPQENGDDGDDGGDGGDGDDEQ